MQGSYFRQFWDVSVVPNRDGLDAREFAEDLKDVSRLHEWDRASALGSHNKRDAQGDKTQVVLVIRGDLLKRYPNTIIYAQQATWAPEEIRKNRLILSDEKGEIVTKTIRRIRGCDSRSIERSSRRTSISSVSI